MARKVFTTHQVAAPPPPRPNPPRAPTASPQIAELPPIPTMLKSNTAPTLEHDPTESPTDNAAIPLRPAPHPPKSPLPHLPHDSPYSPPLTTETREQNSPPTPIDNHRTSGKRQGAGVHILDLHTPDNPQIQEFGKPASMTKSNEDQK